MALVTSIHNLSSRFPTPSNKGIKMLTGRVTDVVLNPSSLPEVVQKRIGKSLGVGTVFYDLLDYPTTGKAKYNNNIAYPFFPNNIQYPLLNELITILFFPALNGGNVGTLQSGGNSHSNQAYYFSTVNVWRNFHHNIFPNPRTEDFYSDSDDHDLDEINAGAYNTNLSSYDTPANGVNFAEKSLLKDLQPYVGDIIYKGRWGQSIRFDRDWETNLYYKLRH